MDANSFDGADLSYKIFDIHDCQCQRLFDIDARAGQLIYLYPGLPVSPVRQHNDGGSVQGVAAWCPCKWQSLFIV